jgi:hypothetical protein
MGAETGQLRDNTLSEEKDAVTSGQSLSQNTLSNHQAVKVVVLPTVCLLLLDLLRQRQSVRIIL